MKILLFTNTDWSLYNFRVPLAKELRSMGHTIIMVSPEGKFVSKIEEAGFKHIAVSVNRTGVNPLTEIQTIKGLKKIFTQEKPDVIHNFTPKGVLYGTTAAKWSNISGVVNSITGLGYMFEHDRKGFVNSILKRGIVGWYKWALSHTKVIFQNEEDHDYFSSRQLLDNAHVYIIESSGVDLNKFIPENTNNEIPIIGLPSRMVKAKGIEIFVEAARQIKQDDKFSAHFVLAGDTDAARDDSITREQLKGWEENHIIEWWGFQDDMPEFYKKVDIVCLPSFGKEGIPRSLIEAAAAGIPIVTTDNTGCRDAVIDGKTGFLVPVKDAEKLALALKKLIERKELRNQMGKNGRALAKRKFALDTIAEKTAKIYADEKKKWAIFI